MYSVLGSLIQNTPSIAEGELARVSTTLLGSLDESDPLAVQCLWESVLFVISTFPVSLIHFVFIQLPVSFASELDAVEWSDSMRVD